MHPVAGTFSLYLGPCDTTLQLELRSTCGLCQCQTSAQTDIGPFLKIFLKQSRKCGREVGSAGLERIFPSLVWLRTAAVGSWQVNGFDIVVVDSSTNPVEDGGFCQPQATPFMA